MNRRLSILVALVAIFALAGSASAAPSGSSVIYSTYDVLGSVSTVVSGVNDLGVIAGYYTDASGQHGFIDDHGSVVVLDGPTGSTRYVVTSINTAGTVTGAYWIGTTEHGFMRSATGETTVLDYPKVGTADRQGTFASQINDSGVIVGYYFTECDTSWGSSMTSSGFVWKSGKFTTYNAPGTRTPRCGADPANGTQLLGLNNRGDMVGTYTLPNGYYTGTPINAGFEISGVTFKSNNAAVTRGRGVTFTPIVDLSVSKNWCGGTTPTAINDAGVIVGNSANGCAPGYFMFESTGGVLTVVFDGNSPDGGTVLLANSINNSGQIGGTWYTWTRGLDGLPVNSPNHGFTGSLN